MNVDELELRQVELTLTKNVLDFWFGAEGTEVFGSSRMEWFKKDTDFNNQIRENFAEEVEVSVSGGHSQMAESQMGCLSLIILLDQFPRNFYRGTAMAFDGDKKALSYANEAVRMGFDQNLAKSQ
jgi:uncharacterized protein (DUF924 family)